VRRLQVDSTIVTRARDKHGVMLDAVPSASGRGKEPDVWRGKAGPDVPFVMLRPSVVGLGWLGVKEVLRHWHLLAVCLEPDGVTSGSREAVDEHGCRQVDVPQAGLEVEVSRAEQSDTG
jgi:hypothetical protein